jgi:phytoene dehydrogenase-like protein
MTSSVLVVGAGVGGLAAALRLAKAGFQVEVLEAREQPGGLASGELFTALRFDAGPYILIDRPGLEWAFERLEMNLESEVSLLPVDDIYAVEWHDGTRVCIYSDLAKTADGFDRQWHGSGHLYKTYVARMDRAAKALRPMLQVSRPGPVALLRSGAGRYAPLLLKSLKTVLAAAGLPSAVTDALGIWTHIAGQTMHEAPGPMAFVPALMHSHGCYYPRGGMTTIPTALERAARKAGVRFRYSTKVARLRTERGKVVGAATASGEFLPASAIISNASGLGTYLELLDSPPAAAHRLKKLPLQSPGVCAYLAVQGRNSSPYLRFRLGQPDERCRLLIQPCAVDHGIQPVDGWLPARLLGPMDYGDAEKRGAAGQLEYLDRMLAQNWWQTDFTAFRVLAKRTPDQWGTTYNLYERSMNPVMTARFMRQGRLAHRSPYARGLYLAGSSTHPGQWVSFCAISGVLAADCLIQDFAGHA